MVLHDPHQTESRTFPGESLRAPAVMDRLAAAAVDIICFFFVVFIVLAPLRREMAVARLTESEADFAFSYSLSLFIFFVVSVLYQSLFIAWRGATPGMLALKLRVVTVWGDEKPGWTQALLRGFIWTLGLAFLCIPYLGVFTNEKRRPLHDRVADTELVALGERRSVAPSLTVVTAMRGFAVAVTLCVLFILGLEMTRMSRMSAGLRDWREELESVSTQSCNEVLEAEENWEADFHDQVPSRLSLALALYSANTLEDECLSREAFRAFQSGEELELAYLAKSFYHSDDAELSDQYLQKVCELSETSNACHFSKMIEMWAEQKTFDADKVFGDILVRGPLYGKIWAIKHFERIKDFKSELELIEGLWPQKYIADFLGAHRSVALWGLHRRDEARMSLLSTIENMQSRDRIELSSWFCYRELAENCEAVSQPSCKVFLDFASASSTRLPAANLLVSYVRAQECRHRELDFNDLASKASGDSSFVFLGALESLQNGNVEEALGVLKPMSSDPRWDKAFREEASRRLILQSKASDDFRDIISEWEEGDKISWEWRNEGAQLLKRLRELNHHDLAIKVGQQLMKYQALDTENRQNLAIMAYANGFKKQAMGFLALPQVRLPAQNSNTDSVSKRQLLDEEYYHVRENLLKEVRGGDSP